MAPPTLSLTVGQSGQLAATVSGSTATVSWATSASAVATVDQTGLVTAVTPGTATITASLANQPNVSATSTVTVTAPPVTIGLAGVTQNGAAVTLTNVQNTVSFDVDLTVPAGFNGAAQVLLGGKVAGQLPIVNGSPVGIGLAPGQSGANLTRQSIAVATTPVIVVGSDVIEQFPNGSIQSLLQVINNTQTVVASQNGPLLGLNNQTKAVVLRGLHVGPTAVRDGRTYGSSLDLQIGSANYGRGDINRISGAELSRVEVLSGQAGTAIFGADAVSGVVNFILNQSVAPSAGGLFGIGEGRFGLTKANATTSEGTFPVDLLNNDQLAGLNLPKAFWDLDLKPPVIPQVTFETGSSTAWLNRNQLLADRVGSLGVTWTGSNPTVTDEGVGGVTCSFRYGINPSNFVTTPITKGGDLSPETATPNLYFRLYCRDGLTRVQTLETFRPVTNGLNTSSQLIGLDFTAPTLVFQDNRGPELGLRSLSINPAPSSAFLFAGNDSRSGLAVSEQYQYLLLHGFGGATDQQKCFAGTYSQGTCTGLPLNTDRFLTPGLLAGEFEFKVGAYDRARNFSGYQSRVIIEDRIAPAASDLSLDATLTAGTNFTIGWKLTDNLEVAGTAYGLKYSGVGRLPIFSYQTQGVPLDGQWKLSASVQYTSKFPASMEQLVPNGSFYMPSGVERKVSEVFYGGVDNGMNGGWMAQNIAPRTTSNFTSFRVGATGLDRIEFRQSLAKVCYNPFGAQGNCQGVPESMTINLDAYYPTAGVSRITEMYLAKASTFSGLPTGLLFDQPMTVSR